MVNMKNQLSIRNSYPISNITFYGLSIFLKRARDLNFGIQNFSISTSSYPSFIIFISLYLIDQLWLCYTNLTDKMRKTGSHHGLYLREMAPN